MKWYRGILRPVLTLCILSLLFAAGFHKAAHAFHEAGFFTSEEPPEAADSGVSQGLASKNSSEPAFDPGNLYELLDAAEEGDDSYLNQYPSYQNFMDPDRSAGSEEGGASSAEGDAAQREVPAGAAPDGDVPEGIAPDGSIPRGDAPDGSVPGGDASDGSVTEGNAPDGSVPGGDAPDGNTLEGNVPDGNTPDGSAPEGNTPDGSAPEGNVPDGDAAQGAATDAQEEFGKGNPDDPEDPTPGEYVTPGAASFTVRKTAQTDTAAPGDTVYYTITIRNTGAVILHSVMSTEKFQLTGIDAHFLPQEGVRMNADRTQALIEQIAPGESVSLQACVVIPAGLTDSSLINQVVVTTAETGTTEMTSDSEVTVRPGSSSGSSRGSSSGSGGSTGYTSGQSTAQTYQTQPQAGTTPKTGDASPVKVFLILLAAAALTAGVSLYVRNRRGKPVS